MWSRFSLIQSCEIFENQDYRLFNQLVTDTQHCLNIILPTVMGAGFSFIIFDDLEWPLTRVSRSWDT